MQINAVNRALATHEGGAGIHQTDLQKLHRSVMACILWESGFYEDGQSIADRIKALVHKCKPDDVAQLAIRARSEMKLRHAPLLLTRELARHPAKPKNVAAALEQVVQRADELAEFLAIYWQDGKQPLSTQVKKGLARAFTKFNAYSLAKYNRDKAVKLRDVLFMCHAKPKDEQQASTWLQLVDKNLPTPDTWEVALSGGADKREAFERLLREGKLGYMALLRNLRLMTEAGVSTDLMKTAIANGAASSKALPFRFVAAARVAPHLESSLDAAMQVVMRDMPRLLGETVVLVDVSGSMDGAISAKSDLTRLDAACALAVLVRGICDEVRVFSFSEHTKEVPPRSGMALVDAIRNSQPFSGTYLGAALKQVQSTCPTAKRIIVFTDEQSADAVGSPGDAMGYMINVATSERAVGHGSWTRVSGFSEAVVSYIQAHEAAS